MQARDNGMPGIIFGFAYASWQDCRAVMLSEVPVGVVEDDFPVGGVLDDSGFQVVAHDPRDAAAQGGEHRCMTVQPGILPHIGAGFHECVPAERKTGDE